MMVLSSTSIAILWGRDGVMLYNDAFIASAGGRHPRIMGCPVRDAWPEMVDFNDNVLRVVLGGGTLAYRDSEMLLHRNGVPERIWANLDYSPLLDDAGIPVGVIAIVTETTKRVLAERGRTYDLELLRAMFEQAPGFVAMFEGPGHVFVLTNAAYRRIIGRDLIGKPAAEAVPEAVGQGFIHLLDTAYSTGEPFVGRGLEFSVADDDGEMVEYHIDIIYQPVRDKTGAVAGIFVQGTDVTERVRSERALRQSEKEYHRLNEALIIANDILSSAPPAPCRELD